MLCVHVCRCRAVAGRARWTASWKRTHVSLAVQRAVRCSWLVAIAAAGCGRIGFGELGSAGEPDAAIDASVLDLRTDPALLAYLSFDDDPGDGIENRAPGGAPAQCMASCPVSIQSLFARGYAFDGALDAIALADRPELAMQAGTVAMWVRVTVLPPAGTYAMLAGRAFGASDRNSWELQLDRPGALRLKAGGDAGNASYSETPYISMGWNQVAMSWDQSALKLYLNGSATGEITVFERSYDAHATVLGADENVGTLSNFYGGEMDEVYVFARALTDAEMATLAERP